MAGVLYGTHLCLTLFVFSLSQQIPREICMFTFASVAMNSKHSRECFVSGMIWTTTFGLSWLRNVRQSSTRVEVKTKLQHGQNKGVKHCWGSCFDKGSTWSTSLTSHIEIGGGRVARPGAVRSHTFVLALVWFLAVFNLQSSWREREEKYKGKSHLFDLRTRLWIPCRNFPHQSANFHCKQSVNTPCLNVRAVPLCI